MLKVLIGIEILLQVRIVIHRIAVSGRNAYDDWNMTEGDDDGRSNCKSERRALRQRGPVQVVDILEQSFKGLFGRDYLLEFKHHDMTVPKRARDYGRKSWAHDVVERRLERAALLRYQHVLISDVAIEQYPKICLLYTSPSPRDQRGSRMPSSA